VIAPVTAASPRARAPAAVRRVAEPGVEPAHVRAAGAADRARRRVPDPEHGQPPLLEPAAFAVPALVVLATVAAAGGFAAWRAARVDPARALQSLE
jgi:hypothetical protein